MKRVRPTSKAGGLSVAVSRDEAQLLLVDEGEMLKAFAKRSAAPTYTAEVFERLHPEKYELAAKGLAMDVPLDVIARTLGIAWRTVRAVRQRVKPEELSERKRRLGDRCFDLAEQWLELVTGDPKLLRALGPVGFGIVTEKALLLRGEATQITELRGESEEMRKLRTAFEALPGALSAGGGPAMGAEGGNVLAMGDLAALGGLGAGEAVPEVPGRAIREVVCEVVPVDTVSPDNPT